MSDRIPGIFTSPPVTLTPTIGANAAPISPSTHRT